MEKLSCLGFSEIGFLLFEGVQGGECYEEHYSLSFIAVFLFKGDGLALNLLSFLLQSLKEYFCLK